MTIKDFNDWRNRYETLTFAEQVEYHNYLESLYPVQAHYDIEAFKKAIEIAKPLTVTEAGAWKANLADAILQSNGVIQTWHGIELSTAAIEKTACKHSKFSYLPISRFDWWNEMRITSDLFFATHFIEHLSNTHFIELISSVESNYIYFEAPLSYEGNEWDDFLGTHKLTYGWNEIKRLLINYDVFSITHECKLYKRKP